MNKLRLLALWCVAAFAAGCAPQPVTVTGTVCDATANGLMLTADGAEPSPIERKHNLELT